MITAVTPRNLKPFAHTVSIFIKEDRDLKTRLVSIQGSEVIARQKVARLPGFVSVVGVKPLTKHQWKGLK